MQENTADDIAEVTSKMSNVQLERVSASPPALKLPQLFSLTPNSSGKSGNMQKRHAMPSQVQHAENLSDKKSVDLLNNNLEGVPQGF